jgi:HD-GYP domain-containing protein (c-di-GMP phosphodiesterase class II)
MHFRTRAFLFCFLPFSLLLTIGFWAIQRFVQSTVRDGLRASLRGSQLDIARVHAQGDLQNSRFLKVVGENSGLKAGLQLLIAHPHNTAARATVEDQLRELGEHMGFDFMLFSAPDGTPFAAVARQILSTENRGQLIPLDTTGVDLGGGGFVLVDERIFQVGSVPVDIDGENIGMLSVGSFFELANLTKFSALVHNGKVVDSNLPGASRSQLEQALSNCPEKSECDLRIGGANWISMPMQSYGNGYSILSFQNVDQAALPIQARLRRLFITLSSIWLLVSLVCSFGASNSIVRPISVVVDTLHNAVHTGKLTELELKSSSILEIQELVDIYNRAAASVRTSGENLKAAYLQFIGLLASALDARDPYTAGHSQRVSQLSCDIATALQLAPADVERVRIAALLHDIGKIGIADRVLQKPGPLTEEEFALVRQHPVIGRRILERVEGFAPFLGGVELHHENWNGTGYPLGQRAYETPIDARIIHVADAYDAMTTDRSYRRGMPHKSAMGILVENAGSQFDPDIVHVFAGLPLSAPQVFEGRDPAATEAKEVVA